MSFNEKINIEHGIDELITISIKMKKFEILDCTLRDGGYYNNWNFNLGLIQNYLNP